MGKNAQARIQNVGRVNSRVLAGVFTATLGSLVTLLGYLFGIIPLLALGLSALILGIMTLFLPEPGRIPSYLATSVSLPALVNLERLLEELYLDEKGTYIPTRAGVSPKVFIPLTQTQATGRPSVELARRGRLFVRVGEAPDERGILLDAPGSEILSQLERLLGVDLTKMNLEDLENTLRGGFQAIGVGRSMTLQRRDNTVTTSLTLLSLLDLEMKLRTVAPKLVSQVGGPVESAIAAAVANATQNYVVIKQAGFNPSKNSITVILELKKLSTSDGGGSMIGEL